MKSKREIQKLLTEIQTDTSTPEYISDMATKILIELLDKFEEEIIDEIINL